jgi:hypothetical protein
MDIKALNELGDDLFTKRTGLLLYWQELADNFYPERADFTYRRSLGTDFAAHLMSSYPLICRRELGDQIGQMLRPTEKPWFHMKTKDPDRMTNESERWLQMVEKKMHSAMYDRKAQYERSAKEGDHDFAAFGQMCRMIRSNKDKNGMLYRNHHLRDVAWIENEDGIISAVWRKWNPTARELSRIFGGKVSSKVDDMIKRNKPFTEVSCKHIEVEADMYSDNANDKSYWSIYYDCDNQHIMEAVPVFEKQYNIARWQTVSGSQYAFSPASMAALPDSRLIQAMAYTLLQAGEKAVNPPMVATQNVVRSDISIMAGGVTWVDRDYDEKLGPALRLLQQDKSGLPFGQEMINDSRAMINQAFYLNKLNLPQRGPEMTAYEIGQRIQEYIRGALPIFTPMEQECNGADCEMTFNVMMRNNAFGSPYDMPSELQGANIEFEFSSPLHDAIEQQKGQKFIEMSQYIAAALQLDPTSAYVADVNTTLRDVLDGIGCPAIWVRSEEDADAMAQQAQADQQQTATLAKMQQGADVVSKLSDAQNQSGMTPSIMNRNDARTSI